MRRTSSGRHLSPGALGARVAATLAFSLGLLECDNGPVGPVVQRFHVAGTVTSRGNGVVIPGAYVQLREFRGGPPPSDVFVAAATSDPAGQFTLTGGYDPSRPCPTFYLNVDAAGYFLESYYTGVDCSENQSMSIRLESEPLVLRIEPAVAALSGGQSVTLSVLATYADGRANEPPHYSLYWEPAWSALGDTACGGITGPTNTATVVVSARTDAPPGGGCSAAAPGRLQIVIRPVETCLFCLRRGDLTATATATVSVVIAP